MGEGVFLFGSQAKSGDQRGYLVLQPSVHDGPELLGASGVEMVRALDLCVAHVRPLAFERRTPLRQGCETDIRYFETTERQQQRHLRIRKVGKVIVAGVG